LFHLTLSSAVWARAEIILWTGLQAEPNTPIKLALKSNFNGRAIKISQTLRNSSFLVTLLKHFKNPLP
jgi:hypothetical protein